MTTTDASMSFELATTNTVVTATAMALPITTAISFGLPTVTTGTTTTVTYTCSAPTPSTGFARSPYDDPRIGWIHTMRKAELIEEMARHGLSTDGTVEVLRKRLVEYWRNARDYGSLFDIGQPPQSLLQPTRPLETFAPTWQTGSISDHGSGAVGGRLPAAHTLPPVSRHDERDSVREMLGLSPNADSNTVKRTLAELIGNFRYKDQGREQSQQGPHIIPRSHADRPSVLFADPRANNHAIQEIRTHGTRDSDSVSTLCNLVRKWGLRFDGKKSPVSFLERLEELIESYSLVPDEVLKALPELLTGTALLWFRNVKDDLSSFRDFQEQFQRQFLPPGYQKNLDEEIRKRTQGDHESFRDFMTAVSTLVRRSGSFSRHEKLELIYRNMRPEYKIMVRRQDFATLAQLSERAEEYEAFLRARQAFRPPPPPSSVLVPETAYCRSKNSDRTPMTAAVDSVPQGQENSQTNQKRQPQNQRRSTTGANRNRSCPKPAPQTEGSRPRNRVCWNCEGEGHYFRDCPQPRELKCFYCKRQGISTTRCRCRSGNGNWTQNDGGSLSPSQNGNIPPPRNGSDGSNP